MLPSVVLLIEGGIIKCSISSQAPDLTKIIIISQTKMFFFNKLTSNRLGFLTEAQLALLNFLKGGWPPPFREFFQNKRVWCRRKEIFSGWILIWLCSIQVVFSLVFFKQIYTFNNCKINDKFFSCVHGAPKKVPGLITDMITRNNHLYILIKTIEKHI